MREKGKEGTDQIEKREKCVFVTISPFRTLRSPSTHDTVHDPPWPLSSSSLCFLNSSSLSLSLFLFLGAL